MRSENFPGNKERKRIEGKARQDAYDKLTIEQKIKLLDERLGVGQGAVRQRARFAAALKKQEQENVVPVIAVHGSDVVLEPAEPIKKQRRQKREDKRGA